MLRILAALAFAATALLAQAQSYPAKPVRIIIPFPPGNTTDIMSRLIAPKMSERLGQQVIVENRPGASGMLGLDYVAKSAPDGYTVACVQGGNMVVLPHTSKSIPYDPRSEEHTSELQSHVNLVCRLLREKKKKTNKDK